MNLQLVYRYILSLSKNENMFYERHKTKQKDRKKKEIKSPPAKVEPGTTDV